MKHLKSLTIALGTGLALLPYRVLAVNPFTTAQTNVQQVGSSAGINQGSLMPMIGNLINAALSFLGVVFLAIVLYAGFLWMTAQGSEEKVKKAKEMIFQGIVGLVIIVAAYAISSFVMASLLNATSAT